MQFLKKYNIPIALSIALGCVHFSPALASIFTGISVVLSFYNLKGELPWKSIVLLSFPLMYIVFLNFKHDHYVHLNIQRILIYAPLLFVPLLYRAHKKTVIHPYLLYLISLPPLWIVIASLMNYFNHYAFLSQMVLESKPLPLFSDVYHIEFSFILTSVLLILGMFLWRNLNEWRANTGLWIVFTMLFLGMHVLSARTGLLAFWSAVTIWVFIEGYPYLLKHWKKVVFGISGLIVIAYFTPSIKNRIINTSEDLSAVISNGDLNHKSFGQRWEAWRASFSVIQKNTLWGVGSSNKESALIEGHLQIGSKVDLENQVQPHNQWIQWMLEWGICFLVFPLGFIFWGLKMEGSTVIYMSFIAVFTASQFESLLERQSGVLAVFFLLTFSGIEFMKNSKLSENSR